MEVDYLINFFFFNDDGPKFVSSGKLGCASLLFKQEF